MIATFAGPAELGFELGLASMGQFVDDEVFDPLQHALGTRRLHKN